jgi:hypothetical protein
LSIHGHIFTFWHLCLHLITKILRNGPRAHFPFSLTDAKCIFVPNWLQKALKVSASN